MNNQYKYIKFLGNHEHLLYSKERATYEVWTPQGNTQVIQTKEAIYKPISWRNFSLIYERDYYPITPLHSAIMATNKESIEWAKKEAEKRGLIV